jgi:acetyl-CoA carboxylase biotin carboxylase subunit
MGEKVEAKAAMRRLGIPVVPGTDGPVTHEVMARDAADAIGYPVLIKAVAGGGGRGMIVAGDEAALLDGLRLARREAAAGFGDDRVYLEKYLDRPRHIEFQILADEFGRCIHLGERECSVQRRHQKVIEEAPSIVLDPKTRAEFGAKVAAAMGRIGYRGLGTVELLYQDGEFHFIEVNTRLQVEHPVTEFVTGLDLVRAQIRVAAGEPLGIEQADVRFEGHAIECRINAEDPVNLLPSPGTVATYHPPGGPGVRVDSALYAGASVPPYYDNLIAKLIVYDQSRGACIERLRRALAEYVIVGLPTSIPLLHAIIDDPVFAEGEYHIGWLAEFLEAWQSRSR